MACATDQRDPGVIGGGGGAPVAPEPGAGGGDAGDVPGVAGAGATPPGGDGGAGGSMLANVTGGPCEEGTRRDCGSSEGECAFGSQSCVGQAWGPCVGAVEPRARDCASPLDNDCDGQVDNLLDDVCGCVPGEVDSACGEHPERFGKGLCAPGTRECQPSADGASSAWSPCVGEVGPAAAQDRCDVPNDDNCDGSVNGGCPCVPGTPVACGLDAPQGICTRGTIACNDGVLGQCDAVFPGARDCSSDADNDCNGTADIDELAFCQCVIGETSACNEHSGQDGTGRCQAGTRTCIGRLDGTRSEFGECSGGTGPLASDSCAVAGDDSNCDGRPNGGCACVIGVPSSCANPDPANCSVQCVRDGSDFSARCVVAALDRDGDHSSSCAQAPTPGGLDCDDRNAAVHPGALESCDGVDNDCDGNIDLGNQLPVAGNELRFAGTPSADVAFSPSDGQFHFAAESGVDNGIMFGIINRNNVLGLASVAAAVQNPQRVPRIAEFGGEFGLVSTEPARVDPDFNPSTFFARVDADGNELAELQISTGSSDVGIAASAAGAWITAISRVSRETPELLELGRVNGADTYAAATNRPQVDLGAPHLAMIGNAGALIWQTGYSFNSGDRVPASIRYARFDANLAITGALTQAAARGAHPDITALGSAYFMAWAVAGGVQYAVVGSNGQQQCSGTSTFGNGVLDNEDAVAVERASNGVVLLATDAGGGDVGVFIYDEACRELEHARIPASGDSPSPRRPELPNLAQGGGDLQFAWTEGGTDSVFRRTTVRVCE